MKCKSRRAALIAIALPCLACSDDHEITGPASRADLQRAAPRIAVTLVAVAAGDEGAGFLDNFLPCTRRGVITYSNTQWGRAASFSGCDLGDGVVIDGSGELRWAGPGLPAGERRPFCEDFPAPSCETAIGWAGELNVTLAGGSEFRLDELRIAGLVMEPGQGLYPEGLRIWTAGLGLTRLDVTAGGATFRVEDPSLPGAVFGSDGMDIDAIPNPTGSLDALTSVDLERLALDPALALLAFLLNEVSEVRGDHTHDLGCGTSVVTFDANQRPLIQSDWSSCETLGIFLSGTFSAEFGPDTDFRNGPVSMRVQGDLTLGGGIPKINLARLDWSVAFGAITRELHIFGELEARSGGTRTFDLRVIADD